MMNFLSSIGFFVAICAGFMLLSASDSSDTDEGDDWQERALDDPGNPASVCYEGDD